MNVTLILSYFTTLAGIVCVDTVRMINEYKKDESK